VSLATGALAGAPDAQRELETLREPIEGRREDQREGGIGGGGGVDGGAGRQNAENPRNMAAPAVLRACRGALLRLLLDSSSIGHSNAVGAALHTLLLARDVVLRRFAELETSPDGDASLAALVGIALYGLLGPLNGNQSLLSIPSPDSSSGTVGAVAAFPRALVAAGCQFVAVAGKRCSRFADTAGGGPCFPLVWKGLGDCLVEVLAGGGGAAGSADAVERSLVLARSVVVEFSSDSRASAMATTWDFHRECAADFQGDLMMSLFTSAVEVLRQTCAGEGAASHSLPSSATAALELLLEVFSWDFSVASSTSMTLSAPATTLDSPIEIPWKPSVGWSTTLTTTNVAAVLLQVVGMFVSSDPDGVHLALQCAQQAASIPVSEIVDQLNIGQMRTDVVFSDPADGAPQLLTWLTSLVGGVHDMLVQLGSNVDGAASVAAGHGDSMARLFSGASSLLRRVSGSGALSAPLRFEPIRGHLAEILVPLFTGGIVNFFDASWSFLCVLALNVAQASGLADEDQVAQLEECVDDVLSATVVVLPRLNGSELFPSACGHAHGMFSRYVNGRLEVHSFWGRLIVFCCRLLLTAPLFRGLSCVSWNFSPRPQMTCPWRNRTSLGMPINLRTLRSWDALTRCLLRRCCELSFVGRGKFWPRPPTPLRSKDSDGST
jgi:hypothetical protein